MLTGLFRLILIGAVLYLVYWGFRFFKAITQTAKPQSTQKPKSNIMVKDEICNTYLPKDEAIVLKLDGKEYFFCSKECQQKFLEEKKD